jgi:hypothetical protein
VRDPVHRRCDDPAVILRVAALAFAGIVLIAPAARAHPSIVDQTDPSGDVTIFDGGGTKPSTAQRKTIDLERFTVTRTGQGARLTFRIARITGSRTYDQIVEAHFHRRGQDGFDLDILANPQHKNGTAYLAPGTACFVDVSTLPRAGIVRLDLDDECLPPGAGVLRVTTYTQEKNGSGPGFSEDTLRVRGRVALA